MKTFTDAAGRTWTIALNLGTAMRVKDTLGIDLLQPESGDPPVLTRIGTDEMLLGEVICCLLGDQFEKQNVNEQQVRDAFDGNTLLAAQKAFYEELVDFFRSRGRNDRAKVVAAQAKIIDTAIRNVEARVDELDIEALTAGAMSGDSPVPSASAQPNSEP